MAGDTGPFKAGTGLRLWRLLRMARMIFGRDWMGFGRSTWKKKNKIESALGFQKGRRLDYKRLCV